MQQEPEGKSTTADEQGRQDAGTRPRGPAIPTVQLNAAEQDPDPSEMSSDTTARQAGADYDNDREDLPGPSDPG